MDKKGLTLVEILAVMVVLSLIAIIVTPSIYREIAQSKEDLYAEQLDNIKEAAVNWVGDHIDDVPTTESSGLYISVQKLQEDGYIDEEIKSIKEAGNLDDSDIFVLAECKVIEDNNSLENNYRYTYGVYEDLDDYQKKMAIKYAKDIDIESSTSTSTEALIQDGYIPSNIVDTNKEEVTLSLHNITVTKDKNKYTATLS